MNCAFYQDSRRRLMKSLDAENFTAVLFGGGEVTRSADENYEFQINTNFYYLTGVRQADVVLILEKHGENFREFLFIDPFDEQYAKWIGHRLTKEEASALSGVAVEDIRYREEFEKELERALSVSPMTLYLDLEKSRNANYTSSGESLAEKMRGREALSIADLYPAVVTLRSAKSQEEADAVFRAVQTTKAGIESLMAHAAPGLYEYQLEAWFDHTIKDLGNKKHSFRTIAASGINATTLHYSANDSILRDGDLILFDLGAREEEYCADISRTFPVNGRFTPLQRQIYEIVLKANKRVEASAMAGVTLGKLQEISVETLTEGCLSAGLISSPEEIRRVYFHGVSHSIGLDTHDPMPRGIPLPEGAIISNEPGLYFPEHGIGVRIEDDLYIRKDRAVNLSRDILKEAGVIEEFMASFRK